MAMCLKRMLYFLVISSSIIIWSFTIVRDSMQQILLINSLGNVLGKKDFVTVQTDQVKVKKQKRMLLVNLKELYLEFKKKHENTKVGLSKFCSLRPRWCVPVD